MINIAIPITVWKRSLITSLHFRWMRRFQRDCRQIGLNLQPLYALSPEDPNISDFKERLRGSGLRGLTIPSTHLSAKSQACLEAIKEEFDFDWLMHLDSDEFLSMSLMEKWKDVFESPNGPVWFGSRSCYFITTRGGAYEFKGYSDHPVKNGGTCIHRSVLESVDWTLWPLRRRHGLNVLERLHLEEQGFQLQSFDLQDRFGVVEVKGGEMLHGMDWFEERDMLVELTGSQRGMLRLHHPMLSILI